MPTAFHFLHAADLHLGCPFEGIHQAAPAIAEALREATYAAFENTLNYAIHHRVDFVVFAGDIYNKNENSLRPQLRFREGLQRLHDAGIPCCVIHGNHDPHDGTTAGLAWPATSRRFPAAPSEPCVITKNGEEIAVVAGISYGKREVTENLSRRYAHAHPHLYAVAVLHTNCGSNTDHAAYAPSNLEDLKTRDFDYWALGHLHSFDVLHAAKPAVVYAGSLQGLNPKETGEHGFCQVHVDENRGTRIQFVAAGPVVWQHLTLDASAWATPDDAIQSLESALATQAARYAGRSVLLRVTLRGRAPLHKWFGEPGHQADLLAHLNAQSHMVPFVWIDRIRFETQPEIDLEKRALADDVLGEVLRQAHAAATTEAGHTEAGAQLEELFSHHRARRVLEPPSPEHLAHLLERAKLLVADRLVETGEVGT